MLWKQLVIKGFVKEVLIRHRKSKTRSLQSPVDKCCWVPVAEINSSVFGHLTTKNPSLPLILYIASCQHTQTPLSEMTLSTGSLSWKSRLLGTSPFFFLLHLRTFLDSRFFFLQKKEEETPGSYCRVTNAFPFAVGFVVVQSLFRLLHRSFLCLIVRVPHRYYFSNPNYIYRQVRHDKKKVSPLFATDSGPTTHAWDEFLNGQITFRCI